jgi:hypothetical protein
MSAHATAAAPSTSLGSNAYVAQSEAGIPLGGLGLPLAEQRRCGIPDHLHAAALASVTSPPLVDMGLDFPIPADGGHPWMLDSLLGSFHSDGVSGCPDHEDPLFGTLQTLQIVSLLPVIDLPATGDYWVFEEHFATLLWRLAQGDIDIAGLASLETWPHPRKGRLPFAIPIPQEPVSPEHITRFLAGFPGLVAPLTARLRLLGAVPGKLMPAELANSAAQALLGIPVDLRVGSLVSSDDTWDAVGWAAGDVSYRNGRDAYDRLGGFIVHLVPVVGQNGEAFGADGAAWSYAIDASLNGPLAWLHGEGGQLLYAREIPGLDDLGREQLLLR